jgi:hypothetical protein
MKNQGKLIVKGEKNGRMLGGMDGHVHHLVELGVEGHKITSQHHGITRHDKKYLQSNEQQFSKFF